MLDLSRIAGFDWDEGNARKNAEKHKANQREAEEIFLDPGLLIFVDEKHSAGETPYHAYGRTITGRLLQASFTMRQNATLVRVVSVRPMSRRERNRYEEEA
jgi:uncharacterized DUF497 family protein